MLPWSASSSDDVDDSKDSWADRMHSNPESDNSFSNISLWTSSILRDAIFKEESNKLLIKAIYKSSP